MSARKNRIVMTVISLIAVAALIAGLFVSQHMHAKKHVDMSEFHGTLLENPREIGDFSLSGIDEKTFGKDSLQGQWTMVFFGFTNCGYLCPTTMAQLSKMYRILEEKGAKIMPKVVMITIDPQRDSLKKLAQYVKGFNPHFYGARGDEDTIKRMTKELGVAYAKIALKDENPDDYDMEHTGTVMLFDRQGHLQAFFTTPHQAELLAQDYLLLVS
ncbi:MULTISPECIES: SCO family protein [Legionella]|uniref:SCO family protein n=1 Tax=Legionella TaxID=445 RepID=UPI000F8EFCA1|nr:MULTISPECIES: SCO family protein [Legionella]MCP0914533.1 SCO family protein [Legionella sp. 27cVA30]RUR02372.1 SCO family protein [Legionella septentrionalis]